MRKLLMLGMLLTPALVAGAGGSVWLDVPFVHQEKNGCGSAALAMVLQYWSQKGAAVAPERMDEVKIQRELYSRENRGIRASAMEKFLRESSFSPYVFKGEWNDLGNHLDKGRPLIASIQPGGKGSLHYVVVVGIDREREGVLLNDPERGKLFRVERTEFEKEWQRTNCWTLLAVPKFNRVKSAFLIGLAGLLFFGQAARLCAQESPKIEDRVALAQKLYSEKKWEETVWVATGDEAQAVELDYLRGMALAHLERWEEAKDAFSNGIRKNPKDERLLEERAGAEYRLKDFASAKKDLLVALKLKPKDEYADEFLGAIFLLEGNLEAALKYWNWIEKPRLANLVLTPEPRLSTRLSDHAVTFHAPQVLTEDAWLATAARLDNLGVFPQVRLEMAPSGESEYAATLHLAEKNGWGNSTWAGVISLLSGAPYQTTYPEWFNVGGRAVNFTSLVRWDSEKRRVYATVETPIEGRSDRTATFFVDARNENWNLSESFSGSSSPIADLNLRRIEGGGELRFVVNGNWSWAAGAGVIGRRFQNVGNGLAANAVPFFTNSTSMEAWLKTKRMLWRVPERRFKLEGEVESRFGRGFKDALGPFGSLGGSMRGNWLPHARGENDEIRFKIRGANLFGEVALDQLYELGLDRDSPLWLRGHGATIDGKKGRAPLGRRFVLINSEHNRTLYNGGFIKIQAGPFLDTGKITDSTGVFGDPRWLIDTGVQMKVRVLGAVSVALSYGRDLRNGRGAFFGTTEH